VLREHIPHRGFPTIPHTRSLSPLIAHCVIFRPGTGGVVVNLTAGTETGRVGTDTLLGIEDIRGSGESDILIGDDAPSTIDGLGAVNLDTVDGGRGNDTLTVEGESCAYGVRETTP
jgi:hypothetical protein